MRVVKYWAHRTTDADGQHTTALSTTKARNRTLQYAITDGVHRPMIVVVLVLAVTYFAVDNFVLDPTRDTQEIQAAVDQARSDAAISPCRAIARKAGSYR